MGKGLNSNVIGEIFSLEPTAIVELYILYYDYYEDSQAVLHFHGGTNGINGKIVYDGQEYLPVPVETEGFEVLGDQRLPRPKLRISNAGLYVSSLLRKYKNLNGAKLIRRRTFVKFLDDANFPQNKNPWGSANPQARLLDEKFFVSRKVTENKLLVELELVSSLELENVNIPARTISSRYCSWVYRGLGCRYGKDTNVVGDNQDRPIGNVDDNLFVVKSGANYRLNKDIFPIDKIGANIDDVLTASGLWKTGTSYSVGDYVFRLSERANLSQGLTANFYQNHPVYYVCKSGHTSNESNKPEKQSDLWEKDICSKKLGGCKLRFNNDEYSSDANQINSDKDLPFGGFPGTENFSYMQ